MDRIFQLKTSRSRSPSPGGSGTKRSRTVSMEDVRNMRILPPDGLNRGFNPELEPAWNEPAGNHLDLELENEGQVFEAGESVIGHAVLQLDTPLNVRTVRVVLTGEGKTSTSVKVGVRRKLHLCKAEEQYHRKELHLLGARGEDVHLEPGVHVLPFCFALPDCLPSSFESPLGSIRYEISAQITSDEWNDSQTAAPVRFEVLSRTELSSYPGARLAVALKESKQLLLKRAKVKIDAVLERQGLCCGEDIPLRGVISVHGVSVNVHLALRQTVKYRVHDDEGGFHSVKTTEDVVRLRYPREINFTQLDLSTLRLRIPSLPPSTLPSQNCALINIKYALRIEVTDSRGEVIIKLQTPVILSSLSTHLKSVLSSRLIHRLPEHSIDATSGRSSPSSFCSAPSYSSFAVDRGSPFPPFERNVPSAAMSSSTTPIHSRDNSCGDQSEMVGFNSPGYDDQLCS